ncbi:hypothetical protein [Microbacterium sp. LWO12-1.2]|uniref:hypothetical protein n=1 Tax=Microbacterium sp. LWO12-1.2 TaxID=3135261 RepID=UPI00342B3633
MARRQPEPSYDERKTYPALAAGDDPGALAQYFEAAGESLKLVATLLAEDSAPELIDETGEAIRVGVAQAEEARRLWVEFITRHQLRTQRELAVLLDAEVVSASRVYKWRYDPLDTNRLTPSIVR